MPPFMRKQVLIVEDHQHLAAALAAVVDDDPRFQTCGVARDVPEAIAMMPGACPDLVTVDIGLPGGSGLDLIPVLREINPAARYLVLSSENPAAFASAARKAGAHGYLRKGATPGKILEVAAAILDGGEHFPSAAEG